MASCSYVTYIQSTSMERDLSSANLCTKTSQVWPLMLKLLPSAQKGTATHASYFIEVPCCLFISKVINNYVRPRVSLTEALAH